MKRMAVRLALVTTILAVPAASGAKGKLSDKLESIYEQIKNIGSVSRKVIKLIPEYLQKRDELRALRAKPAPIDTDYKPDYYQSAEGLARLEKKALLYGETAKRFIHDTVFVERAFVDPKTRQVTGFVDGLGDSGIVTGRYLAGIAFQYGTTGKPEDLEHLKQVMTGAYNLMTLAGAQGGTIVFRKTGERMTARPGLPIRGFGNMASPLVNTMPDLNDDDTYEYTGSLLGLPKGRYAFNSKISRDQVDGLFVGLGAAWEVLRKRGVEPSWQRRIADVVKATMKYLIANGYKFIDFNGKVTLFGDQSDMNRDPMKILSNLAWLGLAITMTGDVELKKEYAKISNRYFGRNRAIKSAAITGLIKIVPPIVAAHDELISYWVSMFNFGLIACVTELLDRYTPDANLRAIFLDIHEKVIWPFHKNRRHPWFDYIYMRAMGKKDPELVKRALGVLGQFRDDVFPFANPDPANSTNPYFPDYRKRAELKDPLFFLLGDQWETKLKPHFPNNKENPFYAGGSIWPLGPGRVFMGDSIGRSHPYFLKGVTPAYWAGSEWTNPNERLVQIGPHDFILEYWYGRYHGFIQPGATIQLDPLKAQARSVVGRLVQRIGDAIKTFLNKAKELFSDAAMRLKDVDKKIEENVKPLANRMATDAMNEMLAAARQFWADLGPSQKELSSADRHAVVDGPWKELRGAIDSHLQAVRANGVGRVDGWFNRKNRQRGVTAFTSTFDATAKPLLGEVDSTYRAAMQ